LGRAHRRLCNMHLPRWLATPGMAAEKIAHFYDDPVKQAADDRAARLAEYRRSLTVETGLRWQVHRRQVYARPRLLGWIEQTSPQWAARLRALRHGRGWAAGKLASRG